MHFHIITLFPESTNSYIKTSILARAQRRGIISLDFYNPRDYTNGKHKTVDDKPYGGGPGMVMMAGPILKAVSKAIGRKKGVKTIILSSRGTQFTNKYADTLLKKYNHIVLISGRYEGIDARVKNILRAEEVSIGPYTLTGGELPAMVIVDVMVRRIPGVLGTDESVEERRTASSDVYTRPDIFKYKKKSYSVPKVLLSGNHKSIENWRKGNKN